MHWKENTTHNWSWIGPTTCTEGGLKETSPAEWGRHGGTVAPEYDCGGTSAAGSAPRARTAARRTAAVWPRRRTRGGRRGGWPAFLQGRGWERNAGVGPRPTATLNPARNQFFLPIASPSKSNQVGQELTKNFTGPKNAIYAPFFINFPCFAHKISNPSRLSQTTF